MPAEGPSVVAQQLGEQQQGMDSPQSLGGSRINLLRCLLVGDEVAGKFEVVELDVAALPDRTFHTLSHRAGDEPL